MRPDLRSAARHLTVRREEEARVVTRGTTPLIVAAGSDNLGFTAWRGSACSVLPSPLWRMSRADFERRYKHSLCLEGKWFTQG